ncbi:MAG: hypothetical protein ACE3JP_05265 [Ectobacillus sp.]
MEKQGQFLQASNAALQKVLENGKNEMIQNNAQTIQQLQQIQSNLDKQMNEIKTHMQTEIKSMKKNVQDSVSELERRTSGLIDNARKNIILNNWLDVAKYGLGTAVFVVPVYLGVKYLFSLFGISMP